MKKVKDIEKEETKDLDLSIIKESDLDKTAAFTDLMSRSEKKKYLKEKDLDNSMKFETEDLAEQISNNKKVNNFEEELNNFEEEEEEKSKKKKSKKKLDEELEEELSKTQQLIELTQNINIYASDKKECIIANIIIISLLAIASISYYVYSILFTELQSNGTYLLINGTSLLILVLLFCIMAMSSRKISNFLAFINYLIIIGFIGFNTLIFLDLI